MIFWYIKWPFCSSFKIKLWLQNEVFIVHNFVYSIYMIFQRMYTIMYIKVPKILWVPINSTDKVSDGCIRDMGFNLRLHQKLIGVLVWW